MSSILALYDISGIQNFIFSTNKVKDIIGASELIKDIFEEEARKIIKNLGKEVLIGGGNAIYEFQTIEDYHKFNKKFSTTIMLKVPGLKIFTTHTEKTDAIGECITKLFEEIPLSKNKPSDGVIFYPLSLMAQSSTDGCQVNFIYARKDKRDKENKRFEKDYLSYGAYRKQENALSMQNNKTYKEIFKIVDMDELSAPVIDKTENMLALVHIDGNNMGNIFKKIYTEIKSISDVQKIANAVDEIFKNSIEDIPKFIGIPYRKIYQNGDDITFVCQSAFAFDLVKYIFEQIIKQKDNAIKVNKNLIDISATAGIVFMKPHYPFYEAYQRAEAKCKDSKKLAKEKIKDVNNVGFWLDYEIIRGSVSNQISEDVFKHNPYYVTGLDANKDIAYFDFNILTEKIKMLDENISRNKLKNLRNSILLGDKESVLSNIKSTNQHGNLKSNLGVKEEEKDILFDALNLMDLYKEVALCME